MIDTILIFAMATAGIHFGLIYATVTGKRSNIFRSEVTRWYLGMLFAGGLLIASASMPRISTPPSRRLSATGFSSSCRW